jgi:hypothetical protein
MPNTLIQTCDGTLTIWQPSAHRFEFLPQMTRKMGGILKGYYTNPFET